MSTEKEDRKKWRVKSPGVHPGPTIVFYVGNKYFEKFGTDYSLDKIKEKWEAELIWMVEEVGFFAEIDYANTGEEVQFEFEMSGKWDAIFIHQDTKWPEVNKMAIYLSELCSNNDEQGDIYDAASDILSLLYPHVKASAERCAVESITAADNSVFDMLSKMKGV